MEHHRKADHAFQCAPYLLHTQYTSYPLLNATIPVQLYALIPLELKLRALVQVLHFVALVPQPHDRQLESWLLLQLSAFPAVLSARLWSF